MQSKDNLERDIIRIFFSTGNQSATSTLRQYHSNNGLKNHIFDESKVRRIILLEKKEAADHLFLVGTVIP